MVNPFLETFGEKTSSAQPTALVICGATGDLTQRKLIPALCNLAEDGYLPSQFVVIGAARRELSDKEFIAHLKEGVDKFSRRKISDEAWKKFAKNIFYHQLRFDHPDDYLALKVKLEELSDTRKADFNYLYYLATSPNFFGVIAENFDSAGLISSDQNSIHKTGIVVEKPFGHDLETAHDLNEKLRKHFAEKQIFRIDHYLGKETVQNILAFRFSNGIFEPLWNYRYIDHIQISVAETVGVGSRAEYFDATGVVRDIIQNHVLQVLSLLCIEPPVNLDADSIRDEKVKVLKSIRRFSAADVTRETVRAQYVSGFIDDKQVGSYLDEKGVPTGSHTETYAALALHIDNWRWSGVPIYVRTGKRLPKRITEITVYFKRPPEALFRDLGFQSMEQNVLAIQVQPKEGISLKMNSKPPGPKMRVQPVVMEFNYGHSFGVPSPEAYERLLLDAMRSDSTLFTRDDEIEESWDILDPILNVWENDNVPPLYRYDAGSWGPKEAATLLRKREHRWRRL
ncbi:MAG: glucose-6-phosphate dehydrogenase [Deltaproteobacteria bacterium]|nr:glucose-6-phosphate dehydrogenase [Deltaproteobacteria bacterium]